MGKILARRQGVVIIDKKKKKKKKKEKKKRTWRIEDFAVPTDPRVKIKENQKSDKYLDLGRELKMLWNIKVTVIPMLIGALGMVLKGSLRELEELEVGGQAETI